MGTKTKKRPVIVTTAHRGVFFGYAADTTGDTIALSDCRNVIYWSADCNGFLGLAAKGPTKGCKIGAKADIELRNITSVIEVNADAEKVWAAWS